MNKRTAQFYETVKQLHCIDNRFINALWCLQTDDSSKTSHTFRTLVSPHKQNTQMGYNLYLLINTTADK